MSKEADLTRLDSVLSKYKDQEGALIPVLQEGTGDLWLFARGGIVDDWETPTRSHEPDLCVVTFYAQFYLTPRGRHTGTGLSWTACHVRGGRSVLNVVKDSLGVREGETTEDFMFSLETVACLGTCFLAPVMMIDRSYYGKLIPQRIPSIIHSYEREGKAHD